VNGVTLEEKIFHLHHMVFIHELEIVSREGKMEEAKELSAGRHLDIGQNMNI
jgi:hypothetical protein